MKEIIFVLDGPIPNKKNQRRNFGRVSLPSKRYVEWNEGALKQLAMQKIPVINYPIRMELEVTLGSWRRKDGDGIICSIFDTLQDGGYIADDTLFHIPEHVVRLVGYEKGKESNLIKITKAELPIAIREYLNTK